MAGHSRLAALAVSLLLNSLLLLNSSNAQILGPRSLDPSSTDILPQPNQSSSTSPCSTPSAPPTPTPTEGQAGDACGRFRIPLDPPCAPGLQCILHDDRLPDAGGVCGVRPTTTCITSTSTPEPSGQEGDYCDGFVLRPHPPCASGLICYHDPHVQITDQPGICKPLPVKVVETPTATSPFQCPPPATTTITTYLPSPTSTDAVGKEGDRCEQAVFPPLPPCGPGLECVHEGPIIPGSSGTCKRVGKEGDKCGQAVWPPQPPCASGLECIFNKTETPIAGAPGVCTRVGKEGDKCGQAVYPPQPPCGTGLECIHSNPPMPGSGGVCTRVGKEGDKCEQAVYPPLPPCGKGLVCVHEGEVVPGSAGVCKVG